jgi:hypothetical protein
VKFISSEKESQRDLRVSMFPEVIKDYVAYLKRDDAVGEGTTAPALAIAKGRNEDFPWRMHNTKNNGLPLLRA